MSIKTSNKGKISYFCLNRFSLTRGFLFLITFQDFHCQLGRSRKDPVIFAGVSLLAAMRISNIISYTAEIDSFCSFVHYISTNIDRWLL